MIFNRRFMRGRHFRKSLHFQSATGLLDFNSEAKPSLLALTSAQFFETEPRLPIGTLIWNQSHLIWLLIWRKERRGQDEKCCVNCFKCFTMWSDKSEHSNSSGKHCLIISQCLNFCNFEGKLLLCHFIQYVKHFEGHNRPRIWVRVW